MKTTINDDRKIVLLMDCIAAMPCSVGIRAREVMTNAEKAKNNPASKPAPKAAANVK